MKILAVFTLTVLIGSTKDQGPRRQQDIPDKPEDLKYKPLRYDVPDPSKMRTELPCGSVLYALEDRSLPKVDITIYVRGGSFWEDAGKEGVAAITGTLMRIGGTATRKPNELDDELDFLAAQLSVSIGETNGAASLSLLSKDLDRGLEILFDVLRSPGFAEDKLDLTKKQILERLKSRNDATASIEGREANLLLYGDYPINRHPTGASVQSITQADLKALHARFFEPWNFIIAASGDFRKADLAQKLEKAMAGWGGAKRALPPVPKPAHEPKPGIYCFHKEGANINQGRVTVQHLGIDLHHADLYPLRVLNYIFGAGSFSSRLMQRVRTEMGLAYDVRSEFRPQFLYPGWMRMSFQSKSETCALALKTCLDELDKVRKDSVTEEELASAKQFYVDAFPALFFENAAKTVATFASAELNGYPKNYYQTYRDKITGVTRDDIKRAANTLLHPDKFVVVVAGNIPVIKAGDGKVKLADLERPIEDVPLPDPVTLERPKPKQ